jgi:hypothetical protein
MYVGKHLGLESTSFGISLENRNNFCLGSFQVEVEIKVPSNEQKLLTDSLS